MLFINSSTSFKPWADNIQNVEVGPPSMVSASEYAKRKGDNCQPKAFTYRLTTESLLNETTECCKSSSQHILDKETFRSAPEISVSDAEAWEKSLSFSPGSKGWLSKRTSNYLLNAVCFVGPEIH